MLKLYKAKGSDYLSLLKIVYIASDQREIVLGTVIDDKPSVKVREELVLKGEYMDYESEDIFKIWIQKEYEKRVEVRIPKHLSVGYVKEA